MKWLPVFVLLLVMPGCFAANEQPNAEAEGKAVLSSEALDGVQVYPGSRVDEVSLETVQEGAQQRFRVSVMKVFDNPWNAGVRIRDGQSFEKGQTLMLRFKARAHEVTDETGEASFSAVFELSQQPYSKELNFQDGVGEEEKAFQLPFKLGRNYPPGEWQLVFHVGSKIQVVDLWDIELLDYGSTELAKLRSSAHSYKGIESDASWREAAQQRIDEHRMADLKVEVVDRQGKPVAGARVSVEQTRHAFEFGTVANAYYLTSTPDQEQEQQDQAQYKAILFKHFNASSFENALKWTDRNIQGKGPEKAEQLLDLFEQNQVPLRGHVLLWPSWKYLPEYMQRLKKDPFHLKEQTRYRVFGGMSRFAGRIPEWDVINEPYGNNDLMQVLGDEIMVDWFNWAHKADPGARLYINDFGILTQAKTHQAHYEKTIRFLLDQNAPLHGIGMQGHFGNQAVAPEKLLQTLDRFGAFGLPIRITEFDMDCECEELQAQFLTDLYTVAFSHPSVVGIQLWGFWAGRHWKPRAALWDKDWRLKPNGEAYLNLVYKSWWTNESGTTDELGSYASRGFLGTHTVSVERRGEVSQQVVVLKPEGQTLTIKLKQE